MIHENNEHTRKTKDGWSVVFWVRPASFGQLGSDPYPYV